MSNVAIRRLIGPAVALAAVLAVAGVTLERANQPQRGPAGDVAATVIAGPPGPEGVPLEAGSLLAPAPTASSGVPVDGIGCDAGEQVAYHVHTHLAVYVNGTLRALPAGIGLVSPVAQATAAGPFDAATRCYYWLHVHAQDGVIHIESPTKASYTLGDFFDIWQQPLDAAEVGPVRGALTVYVNGRRRSGNPRAVVLGAHEDIQIDVGAPAVAPEEGRLVSDQSVEGLNADHLLTVLVVMRNEPSLPDRPAQAGAPARGDGAAEALRTLYAEHGAALLAHAVRFTSDRGRAEDLVQETFLRAWRHLPVLLNDERPVRAWLLQVLRRLSIDAERARRVRPQVLHTPPVIEPAVEDGVDRVVNQTVLREAMRHLPVEQQQLVVDTFFHDIPLHVSARRLGVPAGTARSRLHYALVRMRRYLDGPCVAA